MKIPAGAASMSPEQPLLLDAGWLEDLSPAARVAMAAALVGDRILCDGWVRAREEAVTQACITAPQPLHEQLARWIAKTAGVPRSRQHDLQLIAGHADGWRRAGERRSPDTLLVTWPTTSEAPELLVVVEWKGAAAINGGPAYCPVHRASDQLICYAEMCVIDAPPKVTRLLLLPLYRKAWLASCWGAYDPKLKDRWRIGFLEPLWAVLVELAASETPSLASQAAALVRLMAAWVWREGPQSVRRVELSAGRPVRPL